MVVVIDDANNHTRNTLIVGANQTGDKTKKVRGNPLDL